MITNHSVFSLSRVAGRRSQRVLLRIPVQVRIDNPGGTPLSEDTATLVVNAHGALISLSAKVQIGQDLVLRNFSTAKDQACRVVHVQENREEKSDVGVTFQSPSPQFWNIDFPPDDWKPRY